MGWIAHYQPNGTDPIIRNVVAWHEGDAHVYGGSGSYLVPADKAGTLVKLEEVTECRRRSRCTGLAHPAL